MITANAANVPGTRDPQRSRAWAMMLVTAVGMLGLALSGCGYSHNVQQELAAADFTLWQLPPQTSSQHMSYVLKTSGGKVMVIDGGKAGDAPYLKEFLAGVGNHVHAWFVSHPHPDHVDAVTAILRDPGDLQIDVFYGSMPTEDWVARHEPRPPTHLKSLKAFNRALADSGRELIELSAGQVLMIDGVRIEILGVKNPEITGNAINNSSVVMRVSGIGKSVLFTGDLGVPGGEKILNGPFRDRLRADYVQMAHHGQAGVNEAFYRAVQAKYCLWPTPQWLWENDSGGGKESGPWKTLEVRALMERLNVREHYVAAHGLCRID